jgi:hypothetical protein
MTRRTGSPVGRPAGSAKFTTKGAGTRVAAEGFRRIAFYAPIPLANRLKAVAALQGVAVSELLIRLVEDHLRKSKATI